LSSASSYTLVVPTFNRPGQLRQLLGYLARSGFRDRILVLDASKPANFDANAESIAEARLDSEHVRYEPTIAPARKIVDGLQKVLTPYCSFCADDDLIFVEGIAVCIAKLDANSSLAGAHGLYLNFSEANQRYRILNTVYDAPTVAHDNPLGRLAAHMQNYQAMFYALYRTPVLLSSITAAAEMQNYLSHELLQAALAVVAGGIARVDSFFYARSTGPSQVRKDWHPLEMTAKNALLLFEHYEAYHDAVVAALMVQPVIKERYHVEQVRQIVDLIHLRYLIPILPLSTLDLIIDESIAGQSGNDIAARIEASWHVEPQERRQLRFSGRELPVHTLPDADYEVDDGASDQSRFLIFNHSFLSQTLAGGRRIGWGDVDLIARNFRTYAAI